MTVNKIFQQFTVQQLQDLVEELETEPQYSVFEKYAIYYKFPTFTSVEETTRVITYSTIKRAILEVRKLAPELPTNWSSADLRENNFPSGTVGIEENLDMLRKIENLREHFHRDLNMAELLTIAIYSNSYTLNFYRFKRILSFTQ